MRRVPIMYAVLASVVTVALGLFAAWWLYVTDFRPLAFRPFGDLWFSEGWGRGFPYDTRAKEKYLQQLTGGDANERALAARQLACPGHGLYEAEPGPVIAALRSDPSPEVRRAAANGLTRFVALGAERQHHETAERVLNALGQAMTADELAANRQWVALCLGVRMAQLRRGGPSALYSMAARIVREYAQAGSKDEDHDVAAQCKSLVAQLAHDGGDTRASGRRQQANGD